jgi:hypothetical protein
VIGKSNGDGSRFSSRWRVICLVRQAIVHGSNGKTTSSIFTALARRIERCPRCEQSRARMKPTTGHTGHAGQPFYLFSLPAVLLPEIENFPLLPPAHRGSSKRVSSLDCPIMVSTIAGSTSLAGTTIEVAQPTIAEDKEAFPQTLLT